VNFNVPVDHSPLDRIRIVDINSDVPIWQQTWKTIVVPSGKIYFNFHIVNILNNCVIHHVGNIGSITLDSETLEHPSIYRILYERYEPTPVQVPDETLENALCVKDLDTGKTVSVKIVNDLVLRELQSSRAVLYVFLQFVHYSTFF